MPPDKLENRLLTLETFTVVARLLSFNAAAEELGISPSALSRRISQLEDSLKTRLFQRTTRQVSLTEAGTIYLKFVNEALSHISDGQAAISDLASEPIGRLRISMPSIFGQFQVAPKLAGFINKYPELSLDLSFSDRFVDLIAEGFDIAIRIGMLKDSNLVARKLADNHRILCASPQLIKEHGSPEAPKELERFPCLQYRSTDGLNTWRLKSRRKTFDAIISPVVVADNIEALRKLTISGTGVSLLAPFLISEDLRTGRLVQVLPEWSGIDSPIWLVYANAKFLPLKIRVFIDYMIEQFKDGFI